MTLSRDTYRHLRSGVFSKRPLPSDIYEGEIALNYETNSIGLYLRDSSGKIRKAGPAFVSSSAPSPSNYTSLSDGEFWIDRSGNIPLLKFWQESDSEWVSTRDSIVDTNISLNDLTLTGILYGPSEFIIDPATHGDVTGKVTILGDLQVNGTTTTVNSTTVEIEDKNILLGKGSLSPSQVDGAGITVDLVGAEISYSYSSNSWDLNRKVRTVDGSESSPAYSFTSEGNTGLFKDGPNSLAISTGGIKRTQIDQFGDINHYGDIRLEDDNSYDITLQCVPPTAPRVIDLPDANGTVALVAGSSGQLTYNLNNTQAGLASSSIDESGNLTLTADLTLAESQLIFSQPSFSATLEPDTLTDNRTFILPDASGTLATTASLAQFGPTTSSELAQVISDETGTGSLVFSNSPTFVSPALGEATATTINKLTLTQPANNATLTIADNKTLTLSNTLTFTGTDSASVDFKTGGSVVYEEANNNFIGSNSFINSTGQTFRTTSTGDGIRVKGRLGGASSHTVEIVTTTLTGSRTLTLPDVSGTVVTTGDSGSVTSAMIASGTIVNSDISSAAEISVSKLADGEPRQLLQTDSLGIAVEWTSNIDIPGTLDVTGAAVFDSSVTISGDLIVNGTTTNINTVNLVVEDKNLVIGDTDSPSDASAEGGGITLKGTSDKTISWAVATGSWNSSESFNLALGKSYKINGVDVLTSTSLASSVKISSENIPSGTVTNDDLAGSISDTKLSTISTADKVSISALNIDGGTEIGAALTDVDLFVVDDGGNGTNRKALATRISDYVFNKVSGDITISNTGTTAISDGVIVDSDVSANAEIAVSKLADGSARQLLQTDAAGTGVEWTSNVDVPGTLDVTGIATFDTKISIGAAVPTSSQEVGWNIDKGTLDVGLLNGVLSPLGQDIITLCRNGTASPIPVGTAVMFTGQTDGNSGRLYIAPMVADGTYPGYVFFGVAAQTIAAGADGYVRSFGEVKGLDTDIDEGGVNGQWAEGDILWCDPATPGGFTKFEPQAPNLKLPVAAVVSVKNNGIIMVRWDTGRRLSDLHDVESNGTTADNELLVYNATAQRWENKSNITIPGTLSVENDTSIDGNIVLNDDAVFTTTLQIETPTLSRVITLPDATGTVGLVAGSSGELTYNRSGSQSGVSGSSVDDLGNVTFSSTATVSVPNLVIGANSSPAVKSDVTGITGADQVTNMVSLTQAEYDAIASPDPATFYIITS